MLAEAGIRRFFAGLVEVDKQDGRGLPSWDAERSGYLRFPCPKEEGDVPEYETQGKHHHYFDGRQQLGRRNRVTLR